MTKLGPFFALTKVWHEGKWHVRCIECGLEANDVLATESVWDLWVGSRSVPVYMEQRTSGLTNLPRGPESVYGSGSALAGLEPHARCQGIVAQKYFVVVSDQDLNELQLPTFLTSTPEATNVARLEPESELPCLSELPDVAEYDQKMAKKEGDLALLRPPNPVRVQIPKGLYLPGVIEFQGNRAAAAYVVREWHGSRATVDCYHTLPPIPNGNVTLLRSAGGITRTICSAMVVN